MAADDSNLGAERVWDPLVRLTHWSIAAAVVLNGLLIDEESLVHIWIGYAAFALLGLRLVWGFVGTDEARFASFPPSLAAARSHIGDLFSGREQVYRSHNPVGSLMIYAMWAMLLVVSVSGVMLDSDPFPDRADLAVVSAARADDQAGVDADEDDGESRREGGDESERGEESVVEEVHEIAANLLLLLAAVHVSGVLFESRRSGVNLVRAMITGVRTRRSGG